MLLFSCCHVRLFATPWTVTRKAPRSMGFPRQEYWSGLPFPSPGDLPNPGVKPASAALADFFMAELPGKPHNEGYSSHNTIQIIVQQFLMSAPSSRQ